MFDTLHPETATGSTTPTDRRPSPVDLHVGARVRLRRKALGVSQDGLAAAIDLTFQQVQKYERGSNRISASKLYEIAKALRCGIGYFFDEMPGHDADDGVTDVSVENAVSSFLCTTEGIELAQAFARVPAGKLRRTLLTLVTNMADEMTGGVW